MKDKLSFSIIIFNLIFSSLLIIFIIQLLFLSTCMTSAKSIPQFSYESLRFIVYGSSSENGVDTVSAKITIMDTAGNEISTIERSWPGSYLSFDFYRADFDSKKYYFPYRVRGINTIIEKPSSSFRNRHKGSNLYPYFMENGECILYSGSQGYGVRQGLYKIARFASRPLFFKYSKYVSLLSIDLSRCESGYYYSLFVNEEGEIEIKKQ